MCVCVCVRERERERDLRKHIPRKPHVRWNGTKKEQQHSCLNAFTEEAKKDTT